MLLASCNKKSGKIDETTKFKFLVYDTDDLSIEKVSTKNLLSAIDSGIHIENLYIKYQYYNITASANIPNGIYRSENLTVIKESNYSVDFIYKGMLFCYRGAMYVPHICSMNGVRIQWQYSTGMDLHCSNLMAFGMLPKSSMLFMSFNSLSAIFNLSEGVIWQTSERSGIYALDYKKRNYKAWVGSGTPVDINSHIRKFMLSGRL